MNFMEIVSIIIPTFNSEKTLIFTLESIRKQTYPQECIEILVIDGGSTDKTISIAKEYGAVIIPNEKRLPEKAKKIGLDVASGRYGIYMDSDESFINSDSIKQRIRIFQKEKEVKNVVSTGLICNSKSTGMARYTNFLGDPFSFYIYRYNGYNRPEHMKKTYNYSEKDDYYVFTFKDEEVLPIFDAGISMFDLEYARKLYCDSEEKNYDFAANLFEIMGRDTKCVAMLKDDQIYHLPDLKVKEYLKKLKWRVLNNTFPDKDGGAGFSVKAAKNNTLSKKKYIYILYSISLLFPIIDSIILCIKNRDIVFLMHWILNTYTFIIICWYMFLKIIGVKPKSMKSYGK